MLIYETIYGVWIFLEIRRILEHAQNELVMLFLIMQYDSYCTRGPQNDSKILNYTIPFKIGHVTIANVGVRVTWNVFIKAFFGHCVEFIPSSNDLNLFDRSSLYNPIL